MKLRFRIKRLVSLVAFLENNLSLFRIESLRKEGNCNKCGYPKPLVRLKASLEEQPTLISGQIAVGFAGFLH